MLIELIRKVARDCAGGTAIEYGLIAALIVVAMIASFTEVANTTTGMWRNISADVSRANNGR